MEDDITHVKYLKVIHQANNSSIKHILSSYLDKWTLIEMGSIYIYICMYTCTTAILYMTANQQSIKDSLVELLLFKIIYLSLTA